MKTFDDVVEIYPDNTKLFCRRCVEPCENKEKCPLLNEAKLLKTLNGDGVPELISIKPCVIQMEYIPCPTIKEYLTKITCNKKNIFNLINQTYWHLHEKYGFYSENLTQNNIFIDPVTKEIIFTNNTFSEIQVHEKEKNICPGIQSCVSLYTIQNIC